MTGSDLERALEQRVLALGYDLVELERGGSRGRPLLRLRIDVPEGGAARGITVEECARVHRALEPFLDEHPELGGRYGLEVSSPGLERPLVRRKDFERFAGREVVLRGNVELAGRGSRRLEGELLGIGGEPGTTEVIRLRLGDGEEVEVPRGAVQRAHLVFRWEDAD